MLKVVITLLLALSFPTKADEGCITAPREELGGLGVTPWILKKKACARDYINHMIVYAKAPVDYFFQPKKIEAYLGEYNLIGMGHFRPELINETYWANIGGVVSKMLLEEKKITFHTASGEVFFEAEIKIERLSRDHKIIIHFQNKNSTQREFISLDINPEENLLSMNGVRFYEQDYDDLNPKNVSFTYLKKGPALEAFLIKDQTYETISNALDFTSLDQCVEYWGRCWPSPIK